MKSEVLGSPPYLYMHPYKCLSLILIKNNRFLVQVGTLYKFIIPCKESFFVMIIISKRKSDKQYFGSF